MKKPQVTVLMPVYNAARFLAEAIKSILGQSFTDFEFLIINDGSTDKSLDIIKQFAVQDKRIKIINRKNKGLVASLNEGVGLAKGKYIARQDADDISLPARLEQQLEYLENHPDTGLLGTNLKVIDEKGEQVPPSIANVDLLTSPDDLKLAEIFSNQFAHGSVIVRTDLIKESNYDDSYKHAEDYDLWTRISHKTALANLKEPLYVWRFHEKGVTATKSAAMKAQAFKVVSREFQYYLTHKSEYKFFSFHPFSMRGGVRAYLSRKSSVYRDMAILYGRHGLRRRAVFVILLAALHAPWLTKNYRHLFLTIASRDRALAIEYELF